VRVIVTTFFPSISVMISTSHVNPTSFNVHIARVLIFGLGSTRYIIIDKGKTVPLIL